MELTELQISGLPANLYKTTSDELIIIVGGSNDTPHSWNEVVEYIYKRNGKNILTFSFTGTEANEPHLLSHEVNDLAMVVKYSVHELSVKRVHFVATSRGVYSTIHVAVDNANNHMVKTLNLIDPADYTLASGNDLAENARTFDGSSVYEPEEKMVSDLLIDIPAHIQVNVVFLTLRNRERGRYVDSKYEDRGVDHPDAFPRLNEKMVKRFYENTPERSRGEYIEQSNLPHGFRRDGDIVSNIRLMSELIMKLVQ